MRSDPIRMCSGPESPMIRGIKDTWWCDTIWAPSLVLIMLLYIISLFQSSPIEVTHTASSVHIKNADRKMAPRT